MRLRGAAIGISLVVVFALALLLAPPSPVDIVTPGAELTQEGKGEFLSLAGAQVIYESPAQALADAGIPFEIRLIGTDDYYPNTPMIPRGVVVHNSDSPAALGCGPLYNWFESPDSRASTHLCIDKWGKVTLFVPLAKTAWSHGDIHNPDMTIPWVADAVRNGWYINQFAWSVELALCATDPRTGCGEIGPEYATDYEPMMKSLDVVLRHLAGEGQFLLTRQTIVGHYQIASKQDPVCCWARGGKAVGIQQFDSFVVALGVPPAPPPPLPAVTLEDVVERLDAIDERLTVLEDATPGPTPPPAPPTPGSTPTPAPQECFYTVRTNDSLSLIALRELGDVNRWPEIAQMNGIVSPYVLYVGQVLKLPQCN